MPNCVLDSSTSIGVAFVYLGCFIEINFQICGISLPTPYHLQSRVALSNIRTKGVTYLILSFLIATFLKRIKRNK